jgi:hypothetical protein
VAKADIAAVLALVAALFIAISDAVQQRLAYDVIDKRVGAIALFSRLPRSPRWWLGSLVAAVGFTLQAAALGLGSVVLVQALFVTSLLFALPISAKLGHRTVTRSEWTWVAEPHFGLNPQPRHGPPWSPPTLLRGRDPIHH